MSDEKEFNTFILPVLFKELDHIQAILGRFDTFFLAMKQVCLAGVPALLSFFYSQHFGHRSFLVLIVPVAFLAIEVGYRWCFWITYIDRVREISSYFNKRNKEAAQFRIYQVRGVDRHAAKGWWVRFKHWALTSWPSHEKLLRSCKMFDFAFYGFIFIGASIVCCFIPGGHSHVPCIEVVDGLFI